LPDDVMCALAADARIRRVELTGSRAAGRAGPLSDWDFEVTAARFDEVRHALPQTVRPLRPVVAQWDRLSRTWCYMLILTGPAKVGLIFGHPHQALPPWQVNASTLRGIDDQWATSQTRYPVLKRETKTTASDNDALGSIFGNSRSTTTVRWRTRLLQLNGAAAHTFSLNFASHASSTTAGPKPRNR